MIEKCSIGNMNNNLQNITLIILILILIIVILFYIRNSSLKHDELVEKYTNTTSIGNSIPDQSHTTVLTEVNRLSNFPSAGTVVTLRNCQVAFNNDKTSKYEYADEWKEIETIKEGSTSTTYTPVPVKIIGKDNTTNETDLGFVNFGERSRCFKKMDSTNVDTYKYRYIDNALIKYDNQNYVSLTSNVNGVPTSNYYMEMKFDIPSSTNNYNYFANVEQSICSLNYSTSLGGSTNLGDTKLYRLKLKDDYIIEKLEKININPSNNHIFSNVTDIDLPSLLSTNKTSSYVYENGKFIYKVRSSVTGGAIGVNNINVDIYNFNRELFCNKDQGGVTYNNIKSYKIFGNKQLDVNKLILASSANKDADIPNTIFANARATPYDNKTKVLDHIKEVLKTQIDTANSPYRTAEIDEQSKVEIAEGNRNAFITSINTKNKFINKYLTETDGTKLNYIKRNELITVDKLSYSSKNITDQENLIDSLSEPVFSQNDKDIYTVETFTDTTKPYAKEFLKNTICEILIVGGGGGGGTKMGAGGGGGGVLHITNAEIPVGTYNIHVGKGGAQSQNGSSSIAFGITVFGGGYGGIGEWGGGPQEGGKGGSGGGGGSTHSATPQQGGIVIQPSFTNSVITVNNYNYYGGNGAAGLKFSSNPTNAIGANGGGGAGGNAPSNTDLQNAGAGANGIAINITGTNYFWGGGGGGGQYAGGKAGNGGKGGGGGGSGSSGVTEGVGIGGDGGISLGQNGDPDGDGTPRAGNGGANTGGGGGGCGMGSVAGSGGSGIVIIRYRNEPKQVGNEKQIILKKNNNKLNPITYDFTPYNDLTSWVNYATSIGATTTNLDTFTFGGVFGASDVVGSIELPLPSGYNHVKVNYYNTWSNPIFIYIDNDLKETCPGYTSKEYTQLYTPGQVLKIQENHAVIGENLVITFTYIPPTTQYRVKINRSTRVKINNAQSYTLFDRGTYDIIMGNTTTEIVNTSNPSIIIGSYTNINELIFTYSINKTLNELNSENTVFNSIIPSIKNSTNYYSLGNKDINTIVKYKININRIHSIDNHALRVYFRNSSGSINEILGDDRIIEKGGDENGSIILTKYYITINKNISGNIYLTSEKQIFYVEESRRIGFNNVSEGDFTASINNVLNVNDELIILNNMFGVKTALDNKAAATAQIIKLNDNTTPISISYNSSTISRNSLDTLVTTFNIVNSFDETTVAGQLQSITNTHNFRNVLSPATTNIDEYISYELATEKTPQTPTITSFNIKNTTQKYIYFNKI
jgi:hypothetical protein